VALAAVPLPVDERFRPERRLHKRAEFLRAYDQGAKRHGRFVIVFVVATPRPVSRLGVSATRKFGGSVQRNLAKRRVREVFRRMPMPPGLDVVVVPKREFPDASHAELDADIRAALARAGDPRVGAGTPRAGTARVRGSRKRPAGAAGV
jgi:ribonuclease P protein component